MTGFLLGISEADDDGGGCGVQGGISGMDIHFYHLNKWVHVI